MGLDISFNRASALAAGMVFSTETNASPDDIRQARLDQFIDRGYLRWLSEPMYLVAIPELELWIVDNGDSDVVTVRANTWGTLYSPLTVWLVENGIEWEES